VADKVDKEIKIYDLLAHANKHHFYVILNLVNKMKTKKENWMIDVQQTLEHQAFQWQHEGVNCSYFTCWYAHQVVTNQPVTGWPGNYHEEVQKIR